MEIKYCVNHPGRQALGECVITKRPVCPECSTKYEGVNYSKEGLEELKRRRAGAQAEGGIKRRLVDLLAVIQAPLSLYLLYLFYFYSVRLMAGMIGKLNE